MGGGGEADRQTEIEREGRGRERETNRQRDRKRDRDRQTEWQRTGQTYRGLTQEVMLPLQNSAATSNVDFPASVRVASEL